MTSKVALSTLLIVGLGAASLLAAAQKSPFAVRVEVEEEVCHHELTNNGAGMFWHAGCPEIARIGDKLFVSALEVVPGCAPLNNVRWALYERRADGWHLCQRDLKDRSREPSPLCVSHSGRLLMSVNPTLTPWVPLSADPKAKPVGGPARPEFLEFNPAHPEQAPKHLLPQWEGEPKYSEHSYRAFAADGDHGEFILFQTLRPLPYNGWALLQSDGKWKTGQLGLAKVDSPKHAAALGHDWVSVPYANVILNNRQVHYIAQSSYHFWNRIDPARKELYGREKWGWPMRKLHYAWTPDITTTPFTNWLVVDDTMDDGGTIGVGDSWLAPDGRVHLVYQKEPIHPRLRDTYFPDIKRDWRLCYAILKEGKVLEKRVLFAGGETTGPLHPYGYIGHPRFHVTPDHTLYVIYNMEGTTRETRAQSGTYAVRIEKDGSLSASVRIPFKRPVEAFYTATPRCGNRPSEVADLLIREIIDGKPHACYARLRFCPP